MSKTVQHEKQQGGNHYKSLKIDPITFAEENGLSACQFSVVKYVTRHGLKGTGVEDLKKAIHFCQMLLERDYGVSSEIQYGPDSGFSRHSEDPQQTSQDSSM